ncbi:WD40/YVTN/BNR-like repeat-containing protein [Marisediminicola sp. LYQ85]|uniref:WD40/YVTN/BNR-like repeat-containing protein n=1 Tax=Marisediminicola sp. LYQ85 TaxID=3391062 RepID=UPI00398307B4
MTARARFAPRDGSRRRGWVYAGLAAFLVVDVLLVSWAISAVSASNEPTEQPREVSITAPQASPAPPRDDADSDSDTDGAADAPTAVPPSRLLAAVDGSTAWRATTGECGVATAAPEVTTDAGTSWATTDASTETGVTALLRLVPASAEVASFVGLAQNDCTPIAVRTFVGGGDYAIDPAGVASTWHVDPSDRSAVVSPAGAVDAPCDTVVDLAARNADEAAVLCDDGAVSVTDDAGTSWATPRVFDGAIALTRSDEGWTIAAVGSDDCAGVEITAVTDALAPGAIGCLPLDQPAADLPGSVALSAADGTLWVWTDEGMARSTDGGASWL